MAIPNNSLNYQPIRYEVVVGAANNGITSLSNSTAGYVLTSNGAGVNPSFQLNTAAFPILKTTLLSTDIKSLRASPIVLVSAQGANTIIIPVSVASQYYYGGSNVFTNVNDIVLAYTGFGGQEVCRLINGGTLGASSNSFSYGFAGEGTAAPNIQQTPGLVDNQPIVITLKSSAGSEITGNAANDNKIIFSFSYLVYQTA